MRRSLTLLLVVMFTLSIISASQAKSVMLEYQFKKGDVDKYKVSVDVGMKLSGVPNGGALPSGGKMSMIVTQKVLDVLADGSARVRISVSDLKLSIPGIPQDDGRIANVCAPVTMTMARDGRVLAMENMGQMMSGMGLPGMEFPQMMGPSGSIGPVFPVEPVAVGQGWKQNLPMPFGGEGMEVASVLLAAAVPLGKENVAKVKQTYKAAFDIGEMLTGIAAAFQPSEANSGSMPSFSGLMDLSGWSVFYFSPTTGKVAKSNSNITASISLSMPSDPFSQARADAPSHLQIAVDIKIDMARVK